MNYVSKLTILETHLDSFGHMNNATYLEVLEQARWDMITERGFGLDKIHELKIGPVILEVNIKFLKELRLRETVEIHTHAQTINSRLHKVNQKMVKSDGQLACEADFVVGFFDLQARKLISPTHDWLRALGF